MEANSAGVCAVVCGHDGRDANRVVDREMMRKSTVRERVALVFNANA